MLFRRLSSRAVACCMVVGIIAASVLAGCAPSGASAAPRLTAVTGRALPSATILPVTTTSPTASPVAGPGSTPLDSTAVAVTPTVTPSVRPVRKPPANPGAYRGEGALAFTDNGQLYVLDGNQGTVNWVSGAAQPTQTIPSGGYAWSFDGAWLAYLEVAKPGDGTGQLWIARRDGTAAHEVTGLPGPIDAEGFSWSPTADILAIAPTTSGLWTVAVSGAPRLLAARGTRVGSLAWSPDGKTLAYTVTLPYTNPPVRSDALETVPSTGGAPTQHFVASHSGIILADWWPTDRGLIFWIDPMHSASLLADGASLETLALTGKSPHELATTLADRTWLSWSPDGHHLVLVEGGGREIWRNKQLAACDVIAATCQALPQPANVVSIAPSWSPDGKQLAFIRAAAPTTPAGGTSSLAAWDRTRTLWISNADGSNAHEVKAAGTGVKRPAWSPDGQSIRYREANGAWLLRLQSGSPVEIVGPLPGGAIPASYYGRPQGFLVRVWHP